MKKTDFKEIFKSCLVRLILILAGFAFIITYKILLAIDGAADSFYNNIISPFHDSFASFCDLFKFSVAEVLIAVFVIALLSFTIITIVKMIINKKIVFYLISLLVTYLMCFSLIYGGFCILWGVYYAAENKGVGPICGISSKGVEHEDLIKVDIYFLQLANEYGKRVERDDNNCYKMDKRKVFDYSTSLYENVSKKYPGLKATNHYAKEVKFSRVLSYMDFTGFFFPFTAEANINTDAPDSMTPSVIAHELAHQRGIAREDEANFIAVLACLEGGSDEYVYSASLMALIYLQNALYSSGDTQTWEAIIDLYSDEVAADIAQNNAYWKPFRESASYQATNKTYDAFLKSYDQEFGIETYGRCVDLLVEYYK